MLFRCEIIIILDAVCFLRMKMAVSEIAGCYISSQRCVNLDGSTCATPQPAKHSTISGWPCQRWDCPHPRPQSRATTGDNACINDHNDANGPWCFIADPDGPLWERCWTVCPELTCYDSTANCVSTQNGKCYGNTPCALSPMIKAYTSTNEWNKHWPNCSNGASTVTHVFPTALAFPIVEEFTCPSIYWTLVAVTNGLMCLQLIKWELNKYDAKRYCQYEDPESTLGAFSYYEYEDFSIFKKFLTDSGGEEYDVWLSGEGPAQVTESSATRILKEEDYPCPIRSALSYSHGCLSYNANESIFEISCCNIEKPFVCQIRQNLPCSWIDFV